MSGDEFNVSQEDVDEFLAHYGVKGQKWGVRRSEKQLARARTKNDTTKFAEKGKQLSDDELTARIKRLENEKRYNELNKTQVSAGKKHVREVLLKIGKDSASNVGTKVVSAAGVYAAKKAIEKKFGADVKSEFFPKK